MPKTAKHLAGGSKASKTIVLRLSPELLERLKQVSVLRGMDLSEYLRKAGTEALNNDKEYVKNQGPTAYLGASLTQIEHFLKTPLSREEIYYGNQRRQDADVSLKILTERIAAIEQGIATLRKQPTSDKKRRTNRPKIPVVEEIDL